MSRLNFSNFGVLFFGKFINFRGIKLHLFELKV